MTPYELQQLQAQLAEARKDLATAKANEGLAVEARRYAERVVESLAMKLEQERTGR